MRRAGFVLLLACAGMLLAQEKTEGPANEKAQKTCKEALEHLRKDNIQAALDAFKKADKQDDGHCLPCQQKIVRYATELHDWKAAEAAATELAGEAQGAKDVAVAHYQLGLIVMNQAMEKHKDELFSRAHDEMTKALAAAANFPQAIFADGQILAHLKQDDAAKAQFEKFVQMRPATDVDRQRALRYISQPELARARMAPPFAVTTLDGKRVSLDDLKGKVVLLDFWATWCGPCKQLTPTLEKVTKAAGGRVRLVKIDIDKNQALVRQ